MPRLCSYYSGSASDRDLPRVKLGRSGPTRTVTAGGWPRAATESAAALSSPALVTPADSAREGREPPLRQELDAKHARPGTGRARAPVAYRQIQNLTPGGPALSAHRDRAADRDQTASGPSHRDSLATCCDGLPSPATPAGRKAGPLNLKFRESAPPTQARRAGHGPIRRAALAAAFPGRRRPCQWPLRAGAKTAGRSDSEELEK